MEQQADYKVKNVSSGKGALAKYKDINYGNVSWGRVILCEILITLFNWIPGLFGLALRKIFYPLMFSNIGRNVVFGRNMTIRHPHKIVVGNNVIFDDNCVIDAKGNTNSGIVIGDRVYVGKNSIIYCKNGDISIGDHVNISANCTMFSGNKLTISPNTVIGAYSYLLSGGEYDYTDALPFSEQSGNNSKDKLIIGSNCWIGARVTVLDAASVGEHCVLAAGAVVNKPIPDHAIAAGVPAKVIKTINPQS